MKQFVVLPLIMFLAGCNTLEAAQGNSTRGKVTDGMKKDADAVGGSVKRGAGEIGDAIHDLFKH